MYAPLRSLQSLSRQLRGLGFRSIRLNQFNFARGHAGVGLYIQQLLSVFVISVHNAEERGRQHENEQHEHHQQERREGRRG